MGHPPEPTNDPYPKRNSGIKAKEEKISPPVPLSHISSNPHQSYQYRARMQCVRMSESSSHVCGCRQSGARTKQIVESVECALGACRVHQDAIVHIGRGGRRPDEPTVERAVVIRRLGKLRQDLVRRRTGFVCRRAAVGTSGRGVGSRVVAVGRGRRGCDTTSIAKTQRVGVSGEVVAAAWSSQEAWMNENDKPRRVSQEWT